MPCMDRVNPSMGSIHHIQRMRLQMGSATTKSPLMIIEDNDCMTLMEGV